MENAEWPDTPVAGPVKRLIARFYELVDSTDPESSERLANTVFAEDGKFVINKREMVGRDEIVHWSAGGSHIQLRRHVVQKIYVCNDKADDLLMTGSLVLRSVDGKEAESPYCARCVVDDANSTTPMIKYWQGWLDNTPFLQAGIFRA